MVRVDKDTGQVKWAFQPVPFELDNDRRKLVGGAEGCRAVVLHAEQVSPPT